MGHREPPRLSTRRLVLRGFLDTDVEPLADMNADPEVMRYLGGARARDWSAATIDRCRAQWDRLGYGRFAIEDAESHAFLGWVTIEPVEREAYADDVEIGWRRRAPTGVAASRPRRRGRRWTGRSRHCRSTVSSPSPTPPTRRRSQ